MSTTPIAYEVAPYLPEPRRIAVVVAVSLLVNAGVIAGLARVAKPPAPPARETVRRVPVTISAVPPPPPDTPAPVDAPALVAPTPSPATPPLPDLALPTLEVPSSGLALPRADGPAFESNELSAVPRWKPTQRPSVAIEAGEPVLLVRPDLDRFYPRRARSAKIVGQTWLTVEVNTQGRVTTVKVDASQPRGVFERAARRAATKLRYQPGTRGGRPVASKAKVHCKWGL
jgi:periplasmic protein TonB